MWKTNYLWIHWTHPSLLTIDSCCLLLTLSGLYLKQTLFNVANCSKTLCHPLPSRLSALPVIFVACTQIAQVRYFLTISRLPPMLSRLSVLFHLICGLFMCGTQTVKAVLFYK